MRKMSKSIQQQLEEARAALAKSEAALAVATAKPRRRQSKVEVPSVTTVKDGETIQEQVACEIISQGGPWTTAVQSARVAKTGEITVYLRKYQTLILKETSKLREGEVVGQRVLRQRSSFRINSAEQYEAVKAFCDTAFAPAEAPAAE